ncbi:demethylmenaquinone methyltransferase [Lactobacillus hamsteri]|uniref:bifunctional demethylmenaquinone methyltransferase/2-methoxy-6-polyprenyl-1,4-benzoquinol methylase UbiE n=1 Tax=Lactobacillus hamsteri TaxID=96565 RepID=UPI00046A2741|nr:bifunctional demethylmenaquinone methyltransferase/2-methoxy-6-polyprenyl-1,4-benzoquinol methylase UbiE [Lactobacillus hamsteri]
MTLTNKTSEQDVHDLFTRVASKYDVMNNFISLGLQNKWRKNFIQKLNLNPTDKCLDLCCGTGESTIALAKKAKYVIGLDFNQEMMDYAEPKIKKYHLENKMNLVKGDAMNLPFEDSSFDCVTICFGLRNVPDAGKTIAEAYRVLKKNEKFAILEMSQPTNPIVKFGWKIYFKIFPYFAKLTKNKVSDYQYLSKTSKAFLSAKQVKALLEQKGFKKVSVTKLTWGAGAIHICFKE